MQKDTKNAPIKPAENPAIDHNLKQIITAWPNLPEYVKNTIKTLINSVKQKNEKKP